MQSNGDLHFVEALQAFAGATALVRELGEVWPAKYVDI
jgi:hypothetical protein